MAATRLRAFGQQAGDLDHDFASDDRPSLVTALLHDCSVEPESVDWWQAPVGRRISALLDLAMLSTDSHALGVTLRCEAPACGKRFEVELPAEAWVQADERLPSPVHIEGGSGDAPLTLRHPTGADLRACREQALQLHAHPADIAQALLERLCLAGTPRRDDATRAAGALAEADPLVAFHVHCACPECGDAADRSVDLEALALMRLAVRQAELLDDVHRLAWHYGWSERQIFEVPPSRRRLYIRAIGAGQEQLP